MADKAQTWVYTEDYVAESDALTAARAVATEMGASPVSAGTGAALRMLAAVSGARAVLEVGTGAGVSGLWLLDGMAADGVLTTIDSESELLGHARRNFAAAGLSSHRTRLIAGRALARTADGARRPLPVRIGLMLIASAVVYVPGLMWLKVATGIAWKTTLAAGLAPFVIGDALKSVVVALLPSRR